MAINPLIALSGNQTNIAQSQMQNLEAGRQFGQNVKLQGVREQILQQSTQVNAMSIAQQQGQYLNQLASGLMSKPLDQRASIVAQQLPFLKQLGIDPAQVLGQDLTNQGLQSVIMQTQPFMQQSDAGRPFEIDGALVSPTGEVLYQSPSVGGAGGADPTGGKGWDNITRDIQTGVVTGLNKLTNKIEVIPKGEQAEAALGSIAEREIAEGQSEAQTAEQQRVFGQSATLRNEYESNVKGDEAKISAFGAVENVLKADDELLDSFATNLSAYASSGVNTEKILNDSRAISDIALIFAFFKTVDPTSTVREGEFATVENAGGLPTRFVNMYNSLLRGERMNDVQRNQIIRIAQNSRNEAARNINRQRDKYRSLSTLQSIDPSLVILGDDVAADVDLTKDIELPKQSGATTTIQPDASVDEIQQQILERLNKGN